MPTNLERRFAGRVVVSTAEIEIFPQVSTWSVASFATLTPCCRASITRPANCSSLTHTHALAVRFATVELPSRTEKRPTAAVAKQHFADYRELAYLVEFKTRWRRHKPASPVGRPSSPPSWCRTSPTGKRAGAIALR
jgi:hypothetical protein